MLTAESILITCKTEGCNNTFRFVPRQQFNSTVRVKPPEFCQCCLNRQKFEKAKTRTPKPEPANKQKLLYGRHVVKQKVKTQNITSQQTFFKGGKPETRNQKPETKLWYNKPTPKLINHVQFHFCNPYIRTRDAINHKSRCITCGNLATEAGHFFSVSSHPEMRFLPHNIHGQCNHCNNTIGGNNQHYTEGLVLRYGSKYVQQLSHSEKMLANSNTKLLRHEIITIGKTYQYLLKNKIWVFTPEEFNLYVELIKD